MSLTHTVVVDDTPYTAHDGEMLSDLLLRVGRVVEHPCGGRGICRKCTVWVNGQVALSCRYVIRSDAVVKTTRPAEIRSEIGVPIEAPDGASPLSRPTLVLDIGTTTLALALVDAADGRPLRVVSANNPQRAYGADIMSRISYASEQGTEPLTRVLREKISFMMERLLPPSADHIDHLFVAGNTTMLHLFWGVDPAPMGVSPYTPAFLEERHDTGASLGFDRVGEVVTLPGISAFVGADLVAGLHHVGLPTTNGYRLLVDLGTNAEILLFDRETVLCTAAAAGPCFEGANISCGMSATEGAICGYAADGTYETIGDLPPKGLCGTGLVDAVAALLDLDVIDETGYMEQPVFYLAEGVGLTREDIRQYQTAKAAVHAGILSLVARAGISLSDIEHLYIAGGFATKLNVGSATRTGLLPPALSDRVTAVGNSSLLGTCRYAADRYDLSVYCRMATYVDLASDPVFSDAFMEGMLFE